ncbi:MAG: DUF366 family protein [Pseudomonadota bacterium]
MKTTWIDRKICYDGTQLRSHWIYNETGALGDAIASFEGPADVPLANMVDLADARDKANIFSRSMLHFIVEHFDGDLPLAVARQRLLATISSEELRARAPDMMRRGDDLYDKERKLSVSIATASPVSTLIHFAVNIDAAGAPVSAVGLNDLGVEPKPFAERIMQRYSQEIESMMNARCKVRAVK